MSTRLHSSVSTARNSTLKQAGKGIHGIAEIPIGVDFAGSPVVLDFIRWTRLDDHVAVVGAPGAGTTTVCIMLGLSLSRSPDVIKPCRRR